MHKFDLSPECSNRIQTLTGNSTSAFHLKNTKVENITHSEVIAPRVLQTIPLQGTGKHGSLPGTQSNCKL